MIDPVVGRYLKLGLRLGRHDEGIVDAYFGPAGLAAEVDAEELTEPAALVDEADALMSELPDGWLRDQVVALRVSAGGLAGERRSYADEVDGCYGVRPEHTDESVFAQAHECLDELLPGSGSLADRFERWRAATVVPPEQIERLTRAVIDEARTQTRELVDLPEGESLELDFVSGVSWSGYNTYLGGLRGQISINVGQPLPAMDLLLTALHETYPGHQAERSCHEHHLVRGRGLLEETLVLGPAPQAVVSEGIGQLAPHVLLAGDGGERFAATLHDAGIPIDLTRELAIVKAREPLRWVEVNAALMLHQHGATLADTRSYIERWAALSPDLATTVAQYVDDPSSRTYVINYPAGLKLVGDYVNHNPAKFRRLLTEQIRITDLTTNP
ncbi:hypothetical protein Kfla_1972 [Kribbella flavida DSM 17836]|uniref:DUF885 domain-containing protein n=1 Tax=Kribbella flavida (strain DSM 17836 / JCM 10339 / NBRC 14399) TaxID=479435 RepID=D2PQT1_KRIFD|nr:hypothetical protein [Kribbella flavida]ADB31064.1 hypothetical protein Kfla_1972 [Kribbella flavida DSM 17836]